MIFCFSIGSVKGFGLLGGCRREAIESGTLAVPTQADGAQSLPPNLNVRGALLQVVSYALVRQAAPKALRERLWGSDEDPLQYTRLMFFGGSN